MDSSYSNQGLLATHLRYFEIEFLDLSSFLSKFPAEESIKAPSIAIQGRASFQLIALSGSRLTIAIVSVLKKTLYTANFLFQFKDQVPNDLIPVNPLGLTITYFRQDQAFTSDTQ